MEILGTGYNIAWLPLPNEIALILDEQFPPLHLTTSALALAFDGDRILMTNLHQRGWDIPGGHLEAGETPEQAMRREVWEESGAIVGAVRVLGYQRIRLLGAVPADYRYPHPDSYQVLFLARISDLSPFAATAEARERALFAPEVAFTLRWVQENRPMYEAALQLVQAEAWTRTVTIDG